MHGARKLGASALAVKSTKNVDKLKETWRGAKKESLSLTKGHALCARVIYDCFMHSEQQQLHSSRARGVKSENTSRCVDGSAP